MIPPLPKWPIPFKPALVYPVKSFFWILNMNVESKPKKAAAIPLESWLPWQPHADRTAAIVTQVSESVFLWFW